MEKFFAYRLYDNNIDAESLLFVSDKEYTEEEFRSIVYPLDVAWVRNKKLRTQFDNDFEDYIELELGKFGIEPLKIAQYYEL